MPSAYYPHMPVGRVWIYRLLFVCLFVSLCLFVCTVTDFSADDKAVGVKFFWAVHWHQRQGITHFGGTLLPQKPKIGRISQHVGHAHWAAGHEGVASGPCTGQFVQHVGHAYSHVNITVEIR